MKEVDLFKYVKGEKAGGVKRVKWLLGLGVDPNTRDEDGCAPLHHARSSDLVRALIDAGADPNARDDVSATPLHHASELDVVAALIAGGADVNAEDDSGFRPLQYFIGGGGSTEMYYPTICALIEAGSDVNLQCEDGENLLFNAQGADWTGYLIQLGVDVHHRSDLGRTPLHSLVDVGAIRALLDAGADANVLDNWNETPLFNKDAVGVAVLLAAGTDPSVINCEGRTAVERLANEFDNHQAADLVFQALVAKQERELLNESLPSRPVDEPFGDRGKGRL